MPHKIKKADVDHFIHPQTLVNSTAQKSAPIADVFKRWDITCAKLAKELHVSETTAWKAINGRLPFKHPVYLKCREIRLELKAKEKEREDQRKKVDALHRREEFRRQIQIEINRARALRKRNAQTP